MSKRGITRCMAFVALAIGLACLIACEPRLPDLSGQITYNSRLAGLGDTLIAYTVEDEKVTSITISANKAGKEGTT